MASAGPTSRATMRACGCGDRSVRPHSMPSAYRSDEKANRPWTLGLPSGRIGLSPTRPPADPPRLGGAWRSVTVAPRPYCDHLVDRGEDATVAGAAAQVSRQRLAHVQRARLGHAVEQIVDGDDEQIGRASCRERV